MRKTLFCIFVLALPVAAQLPFGAGIKVGTKLTDAFDIAQNPSSIGSYTAENKRFIIGPAFELRLPAGFAIELDALYSQLSFNSRNIGNTLTAVTDASSWEFPLLLKKKFGGIPFVSPFVDVGASYRRLWDVSQVGQFITGSSSNTSDPAELVRRNNTGFVVGGGLEIRAILLRVTPEVRFTRWGTDSFRSGIAGLLETNRNQAQFLVGISF